MGLTKRRKRTSHDVPAKGRLREMADRLWALAVKADWNHRCAVCGNRGRLNSHHLIPRQHQATRYDLCNGCCLCAHHHQFDPDVSPHQNAAGWMEWLLLHHAELQRWYVENNRKPFSSTTNAAYYVDVIRGLREYVEEEDYSRIVGKRFAEYLDSSNEEGA